MKQPELVNKTVIELDKLFTQFHDSTLISLQGNHFSHSHGEYLRYQWFFIFKKKHYRFTIYGEGYGWCDGEGFKDEGGIDLSLMKDRLIDLINK